jgi:hypothetical protein
MAAAELYIEMAEDGRVVLRFPPEVHLNPRQLDTVIEVLVRYRAGQDKLAVSADPGEAFIAPGATRH